jgi:hypothetical protein
MHPRPPLAQVRDKRGRTQGEVIAHLTAAFRAREARAMSQDRRISLSSAGVNRIRFDGLARYLSARISGHPNEIATEIYESAVPLARARGQRIFGSFSN